MDVRKERLGKEPVNQIRTETCLIGKVISLFQKNKTFPIFIVKH